MKEKNCLIVKLPDSVSDTTIPKLNELRLPIIRDVNDGSSRILLACMANITDGRYPIAKYSGGFKNTSGVSLGTSVQITTTHTDPQFPITQVLVIEPRKGTYISIENADRLSVIKSEKPSGGWANDTFLFDFDNAFTSLPNLVIFSMSTAKTAGDAASYLINKSPKMKYINLWNPSFKFISPMFNEGLLGFDVATRNFQTGVAEDDANSYVSIPLSTLPTSLKILRVVGPTSGNGVTGNLSTLPAELKKLSLHGSCNKTTGDFKDIPASLNFINFTGIVLAEGTYKFTGDTFAGRSFTVFKVNAILASAHLDALLVALSKATWTGEKVVLLYGTRTSASDVAMSDLSNLGVTVTINNI